MNFRLDAQQDVLHQVARAVATGRFPLDRTRRAEESHHVLDPDDWGALAEAGVFSLRRDGYGLADAVLVFEELGQALVPGPLVSSHLATTWLGHEGTKPVGAILPGGLLPWAEDLAAIAVVGDDGQVRLSHDLPPGVPIERGLDPLTPLTRIADAPRGTGDGVDASIWQRELRILLGAYAGGMATATCAMAVEYAKERVQFGRPIGGFQAVKHLCADMLVAAELARVAVRAAALAVDEPGTGDPDRLASGAALIAIDAAESNARKAIQVHGGAGFTWESSMHLYLMHSRMLRAAMGASPSELAVDVAERW